MTLVLEIIGVIAGSLLICVLLYIMKWVRHAWDVDETSWMKIRDNILADPEDDYESPTAPGVHTRYAGVSYTAMTGMSPIIVQHRKPLEKKIRHKIQRLFPPWIRVEFQEVDFPGEKTVLYGRGDLIREPLDVTLHPAVTKFTREAIINGMELEPENK